MKANRLELIVPETHPCYADHFPGNPLVPGALLLQWIFELLANAYPGILITAVKSAKFLHAVRPGDTCRLETIFKPESSTLVIECIRDNETVCICRLNVSINQNRDHEQSTLV
jgi:3-hydroxymyristoyl/3-hydroxydecanoyl-(acyl carrier protein) dehydratase